MNMVINSFDSFHAKDVIKKKIFNQLILFLPINMVKCGMRLRIMAFLSMCIFCAAAARAGFLQPTSFPKTFDDLSFFDRMALKIDDYETLDTIYDENGHCVSGCAYARLNLEDELSAMQRWDARVKQELVNDYGYIADSNGNVTPPQENSLVMQSVSSVSNTTNFSTPAQPFPGTGGGIQNVNCAVHNPKFTSHDVPYGSPLGHVACITSPYGRNRKLPWYTETRVHRGIDIAARIGEPIYAPADGTIETVFNMNASCGNGIIIQHGNGYRTQYCHLSEVSVSKNEKISAGCLIGKTGNTGPTTGPHLHYAVKKWDGTKYEPTDPANFIEPEHRPCY